MTTKHVGCTVVAVVVVVGAGCAIAWQATDASVDDTVDGICDVVLAVLVVLVVEERQQLGLDWRLTTKHVDGTVVVVVVGVGCTIALKATDASVDDTVDVNVDVLVLYSVAVKCNLRKLAT